jgi:hypothetical protein
MSLYVLEYEPGARGCPAILKGEINMDWQWDDFEPHPDKFSIVEICGSFCFADAGRGQHRRANSAGVAQSSAEWGRLSL